jgi:uncharacterized sulfatase
MTLFENSARVPLIIASPDGHQNARARTMAELVDLSPTLAELCGLSPPEYIDGISLVPALENPEVMVKDAAFTQLRRDGVDSYSIRTPRWRYTLWNGGRQGEQLFDMQSDPGEMRNLAGDSQYADVIASLKQQLRDYAH